MNKLIKIASNIFQVLALVTVGGASASAAMEFASTSQLAEGTWAKIGVTENGIYEITYDELRALGFKNPEKVGVWGEGGIMYPLDFQDRYKVRKIPDGVSPIGVLHRNQKLYFYAKGPENFDWITDTHVSSGIRITSNGLSIYSNYGIYLLSDTQSPRSLEQSNLKPSGEKYVSEGLSYVYHEKDINQGDAYSSQEFWGEDFMDSRKFTQLFDYYAPGLVQKGYASLGLKFMAQSGSYQPLFFGIEGDDENMIATRTGYVNNVTTYYRLNELGAGNVNLSSKRGKVKIYAPDNEVLTLQKRLDWWMLTYTRNLTFDEAENQFYARPLFTAINNVKLPAEDALIWDITNASLPINIDIDENGIGATNNGYRDLIFFRTSKEQKKPMLMKKIENQNLHGLASTANPSMIIFTTAEMEKYARELADFHKAHENKEVLVVKAEDVYNEFSSGRPDPMAYRSFAKMMHDKNGSKLEAVLFYGPIKANVRSREADGTMPDLLIAYQSELGLTAVNTNCIIDVYGMIGDSPISTTSTPTINSNGTSIILSTPMDISVGVIPVISEVEAKRINKKTINYILDPSKPYWNDRMIFFCDDHDDALHVTQSERMANALLSKSGSGATAVKAYAGEYGKNNIVNKLVEAYNEGAIANNYIGHGSTSSVGMTEFLVSADVLKLQNPRLTFMNFAGCMATMYENGIRGVPEHMFLSSDNGLVGGQLSVRTSYANENENYMTKWQEFLLSEYDEDYKPLTIGEVSRLTKNSIKDSNGKMKFHLFGDPLLRLPVATSTISTNLPDSAKIGETIEIKGKIVSPAGGVIDGFKGKLVAKWIEGPHKEKILNKISGYQGGKNTSHPNGYNDSAMYSERVLDIQTYDLKKGEFTLNVDVSEVLSQCIGGNARLSLTAYDMDKEVLAWKSDVISIKGFSNQYEADNQVPTIDKFEVPQAKNGVVSGMFTIVAEVSDNNGLRTDETSPEMPFVMLLDGKRVKNLRTYVSVENGSKKMHINVPVEDMEEGHHSVELHVADYAGLRAQSALNFEVRTDNRLPAPILEEGICSLQATLRLENMSTGPAVLRICDSQGNEVYTAPFVQGMKWNLCDAGNNRVKAGIYKAWVEFNAPGKLNNSTHQLTIPVLKTR